MRAAFRVVMVMLGGILLSRASVRAQAVPAPEDSATAARYVDRHTSRLERYATRLERQQDRLLARLARREKSLLARLRRTDSAAAAHLAAGTSFDSLRRRKAAPRSGRRTADAAVDSLRSIGAFAQSRVGGALPGAEAPRLNGLDARLAARRELAAAAQGRLRELQVGAAGKVPGLQSLEKTAFYTGARLKAWRSAADQPSKLEEKALEALQGTEGFSEALSRTGGARLPGTPAPAGGGTVAGATTAADLEKLGFQTKQQVRTALQQQFGSSLGAVQQGMGKQVADWQGKLTDGKAAFDKARGTVKGAKNAAREAKSTVAGLRRIDKPSFRVNPMRGLPFYQRLEKGYTFNASKAAAGRPALLDGGVQVAFKHTPSLSYGVGGIASLGLGQNWNHIRISAEGLGGRAFAQWTWQWGLGAFTGYERTYRLARFSQAPESPLSSAASTHANEAWTESLLVGITKTYRIGQKHQGAVNLLYDAWSREKTTSPFIIRYTVTR